MVQKGIRSELRTVLKHRGVYTPTLTTKNPNSRTLATLVTTDPDSWPQRELEDLLAKPEFVPAAQRARSGVALPAVLAKATPVPQMIQPIPQSQPVPQVPQKPQEPQQGIQFVPQIPQAASQEPQAPQSQWQNPMYRTSYLPGVPLGMPPVFGIPTSIPALPGILKNKPKPAQAETPRRNPEKKTRHHDVHVSKKKGERSSLSHTTTA
jgi:hypothetical protein